MRMNHRLFQFANPPRLSFVSQPCCVIMFSIRELGAAASSSAMLGDVGPGDARAWDRV